MMDYLLLLWPQVLLVIPDFALVFFIGIAILCRFNKMDRDTSNVIAWQYGALFAGSLCAFVFRFMPDLRDFAPTAGIAGVAVFLLLSTKRWSGPTAPEGTRKRHLRELTQHEQRQAVGGTKK